MRCSKKFTTKNLSTCTLKAILPFILNDIIYTDLCLNFALGSVEFNPIIEKPNHAQGTNVEPNLKNRMMCSPYCQLFKVVAKVPRTGRKQK